MAVEAKKDVKEEVEESTTKEVVNESDSTTDKDKNEDESNDEDVDLFGGQEGDIPYARFKEVNSKKKEAEKELNVLKNDMQSQVDDAVYRRELELRREYEDRLTNMQSTNDDSYDDYESGESADIKALKQEVSELQKTVKDNVSDLERDKLQRNIKSLKKEYPALQEEHVMAIAKIRPKWSWEECAEYSHKIMKTHVNNIYTDMVEQKKVAAKKKVTLGAEGLRNMKPEDKPKTFAEAAEKAVQFLGGD